MRIEGEMTLDEARRRVRESGGWVNPRFSGDAVVVELDGTFTLRQIEIILREMKKHRKTP